MRIGKSRDSLEHRLRKLSGRFLVFNSIGLKFTGLKFYALHMVISAAVPRSGHRPLVTGRRNFPSFKKAPAAFSLHIFPFYGSTSSHATVLVSVPLRLVIVKLVAGTRALT